MTLRTCLAPSCLLALFCLPVLSFLPASASAHSQALPVIEPSAAPAQQAGEPVAPQAERPLLGLMGTIPIYWGESSGIGDILSGTAERHWARDRLERDWRLLPLDRLDARSLAGVQMLLLAQPRALSPDENVALDAWVRQGGRLVLFADPMLTGESHFPFGDRRRPQDVILLSPLLRHWGLDLLFDENQPDQAILRDFAGTPVPMRLPGQFKPTASAAACITQLSEFMAICSIGSGRAVILADAALLDIHDSHPAAPAALDRIIATAFTDEH